MNKTEAAIFAGLIATASLSGCAEAQTYPPSYHPAARDIGRRINWVQVRINRGWHGGALSPSEYRRVQGELNHIKREYHNDRTYHRGGLDQPTLRDLQARLDMLNDQIHWIHVDNERRPW